jgi:site-specific recombinase XerD
MTVKEDVNEKRDAFVRAFVTLPHNSLRHSFASYLLAETKDFPAVSYDMQHSKTAMTEKYEGRATEADAKRYFAVLP